jgi:hypothetical protein
MTVRSRVLKNKSVIKAHDVENSTIIGVQYGLNEDAVRRLLREELEPFAHREITKSLYICGRQGAINTLGFAVNNSGLLLCPSIVGTVDSATNISTNKLEAAKPSAIGSILQAIRIPAPTFGLVPAYWLPEESDSDFWRQDAMFAYDENGERQTLTVTAVEMDGLQLLTTDGVNLVLNGLVECEQSGATSLVGGPVFTDRSEVLGIVVARLMALEPEGAESRHTSLVMPWAPLKNCIEMSTA